MKIVIDENKCVAAGQCVAVAADYFDQRDEDGIVVLLSDSPTPESEAAVRNAAALCPGQAIVVED